MPDQPMPVRNHHPSIQGLVRADLEQREHVGIQRYGTPLQPHNGRDALRDAYEEALDLACYLKQAMVERELGARPGSVPATRTIPVRDECGGDGCNGCTACWNPSPGDQDKPATRTEQPAQGGPWTRHGHPIPGLTVDGPGRPDLIARCGGPELFPECLECRADAARLRRQAGL